MRALLLAITMAMAMVMGAPSAHAQSNDDQPRGRSSFWGSSEPSPHGAYRWRLLGIGIAVLGVTGLVMVRLVRRANKERANKAP
jgi:hypothetical protein